MINCSKETSSQSLLTKNITIWCLMIKVVNWVYPYIVQTMISNLEISSEWNKTKQWRYEEKIRYNCKTWLEHSNRSLCQPLFQGGNFCHIVSYFIQYFTIFRRFFNIGLKEGIGIEKNKAITILLYNVIMIWLMYLDEITVK